MNATLFIPAGTLLVGLGQLAGGIAWIRKARRLRALVARCRPARAVVTGVGTRTMMMPINTYGVNLPVVSVRYLDGNAVMHDSTLAIERSWERYAAGQEIDVLYDPEKPDTVLTRGSNLLFDLAGPFFVVLGSVFVVLALLLWYVVVRWF